ncbi:MAG: hypothetical protein AAGJ18_28935, partial [Bacteroidota bacterium]
MFLAQRLRRLARGILRVKIFEFSRGKIQKSSPVKFRVRGGEAAEQETNKSNLLSINFIKNI